MRHFKGVHVGKSTIAVTNTATKTIIPKPVKVKVDNAIENAEGEIIPWGANNTGPQDFYNKKYLKNGASVGGINILKSGLHGNGFRLIKEDVDAKGNLVIKNELLKNQPDIRLFVRDNKLNKYWYEKITDQALFNISFTEHIVSMNGEKIVRVKRHQACHCRYAKRDDNGLIPYVYINSDWNTANEKYTSRLPYMDPSLTAQEIKEYCKVKNIKNFMTSSFYPLVDENFYPKADWHAVDRSGWIDVANSVPELKQAIFENQLHFKHIVYISDFYFESFYKEEWDDFDAEKRQNMREELAAAIDDHMSGNKAGGRSLTAPIFDDATGKPVKGIIIEPVDNKLKDGSYLPDASAANSEILFAIGVNPAIIGAGTPGGSNLGGSGSNIREAYTVLSASLAPKRVYVLDDFELWRDFNGWDADLEATFPTINLTTLDKNPTGQETTIQK